MNKAKSVINLGENAIVLVIGRNNPFFIGCNFRFTRNNGF